MYIETLAMTRRFRRVLEVATSRIRSDCETPPTRSIKIRGMIGPFNEIAIVFERVGLIIDTCVSPSLAWRGGFSFSWLCLIETGRGAFGALPNEQAGANAGPTRRGHSIGPFRLASVGEGWN
jgi:hypothetical protein